MLRTSVLTCAGLIGSILLVGCTPPPESKEPIRSVKLITIGETPIQRAYEFAADVRPRVETRLGFRVPGKAVKRFVEVGQRVKPGQVLAELDPVDMRLAIDAARGQVQAAQAQVQGAVTNRELAEIEMRRVRELNAQNFVSGAELDRRALALKAAQSQLEQAQAQLQSARAQLAAQQSQEGHARLVADAQGVVVAVDIEVGQVVAAGTPVVRIAVDGPRDVVFAVPEDKSGLVTIGSEVSARSWSTGQTYVGRVREISPVADPLTRTYLVRMGLDQKADLALGATMSVVPSALSLVGIPVIKVPTSALRQDGQKSAVWLYDPATKSVKSQAIQVASADGNDAVVAEGLRAGMQIVATGVHVLTPGQKVNIYQARSSTTAGKADTQAVQSVSARIAAPASAASR